MQTHDKYSCEFSPNKDQTDIIQMLFKGSKTQEEELQGRQVTVNLQHIIVIN